MLPFSGTSFPAFIGFHQDLNTFAYTRSVQPFTSTFDETVGSHHGNLDNFLGYFSIRLCEDSSVRIVAQLNGRVPFSHVLINEKQAELAGFAEGQEVILDPVQHTICESVEIVPLTAGDFEILDKNSLTVEDELLQQISIVQHGMIMLFWVSPSIFAKFRVGKIIPDTDLPVILHNTSELLVAPVTPNSISPSGMHKSEVGGVSMKKVEKMLRSVNGDLNLFHKDSKQIDLVLRCLPRELVENKITEFFTSNPSVIFSINPDSNYVASHVVRIVNAADVKKHSFAILIRLPSDSQSLEGVFQTIQKVLKEKPVHCLFPAYWNLDYVGVHMTGVIPKKYHELAAVSVQVKITNLEISDQQVQSKIQNQASVFPVVFGSGGMLHTVEINGSAVDIFLSPDEHEISKRQDSDETCFAITSETMVKIEAVSTLPESIEEKPKTNYGVEISPAIKTFMFQTPLVKQAIDNINFHFTCPEIPAKLLLLGQTGSGKTAVTAQVANILAQSNRCVFSTFIDCNTWKGKQSDTIEKICKVEMKKLEARRPSLLILDNLDFFQLHNEDEQRQIGIERIFQLLRSFILMSKLPVIVTARKRTTLHKCLVAAGGSRIFDHIFHISALTQAQREDILRELIEPDCDVSGAAKVTENFTVSDLKKLAIRVQVEATARGASTPSADDVADALKHSRPAGHVVQQKTNERKWNLRDVGGMEKQKQLLTEVLFWPTKYSELFDSCGIKLGRGVLLHGPSGCGKTLLAKAFSDETHFNIISVKGPELLSKYIGSSEENVRQVFERARSSSPCIILFDELDSLAPKRGSDSTGVTDRVVNQLLTELDGAEGLHGVFVIGCTSRLDLIDPALIRPGRFDHLVECGLPTREERASILTVILMDVSHSSDVNAKKLGDMTEGWTGAELKTLVTNSKFEAARRMAREGITTTLSVTKLDVEAVFEDSKPKERSQRQEIFRAGQRVTLA